MFGAIRVGAKPILKIVKKGAKIDTECYKKMLSGMFKEIGKVEGRGCFDKKIGTNFIWQQDGAPGLPLIDTGLKI